MGFFVYQTLAERKAAEQSSRVSAIVVITFLSVLISNGVSEWTLLPDISGGTSVRELFEAFFGYNFLVPVAVAVFLGFCGAWIHNKGLLYRAFKFTGVTRQTGKNDPWHQVFTTNEEKWCRIVFDDGTRLVGWPRYYSLDATETPQLFLADATWHRKNGGAYKASDILGPGVLITEWANVRAIEFLD